MPRPKLIAVLAFLVACSTKSGTPGIIESRSAEGGGCLEDTDCQPGLYCPRSGRNGLCGACAPGGVEGATCPSFPNDPSPPCGFGLVCVIPGPSQPGTCM